MVLFVMLVGLLERWKLLMKINIFIMWLVYLCLLTVSRCDIRFICSISGKILFQQKQQLQKMRDGLHDEISFHEEQIKRHQEAINRHKKRITEMEHKE